MFMVSIDGTYNFTLTADFNAFVPVLVLYENSFDPSTPLSNALIAIGPPFSFDLFAGTTYIIVPTRESGGTNGVFRGTISGPGEITPVGGVVVPEPTTMLLLATGLAGVAVKIKKIKFAHNNIHPRYPHFNFTAADVYNKMYNPHGRQTGDTYRFPYMDGWFDVVYAASVFTHLLPPDAANYLKESRRVLRKGGRCLFSFFVLDHYRGPGTSTAGIYEFDHPLADFDGVAVYDPQVPEHVIAYKIAAIKEIASEAGLKVLRIVPGFWSKAHKVGVNEQALRHACKSVVRTRNNQAYDFAP